MRTAPLGLIALFLGAAAGCGKGGGTAGGQPLGRVVCWGLGQSGQIGDGQLQQADRPTSTAPITGDIAGLFAQGSTSCARLAAGGFACWGDRAGGLFGPSPGDSSRPTPVTIVPDAVELAMGSLHACARRPSGEVLCWGANLVGQLGNGQAPDPKTKVAIKVGDKGAEPVQPLPAGAGSDKPVAVTGLTDAVEIAAGRSHTCARRRDGGVVCWGGNSLGQLGDGNQAPNASSDRPVAVADLTDATAIFAGGNAACALRAKGGLWCWGSLSDMYPSDGARPIITPRPAEVPGQKDAVEVALSEEKAGACARRASGAVLCWTAGKEPQAIDGLAQAKQVVAGMGHFCALLSSGEVTCWGDDFAGALGIPSTERKGDKQPIPGLDKVVELAAGSRHTCARRSEGQ